MPRDFHQFLSLPQELQLMIFEEALMVSLHPRIVCLDTDERAIYVWDNHLLGWCWRVSNREQVLQQSPAAVATSLLHVSGTARHAANRFLDRLARPLDPPQVSHALMGLGLCLRRDVFWLPDELEDFVITSMGPAADLSPTDDEGMSSIMISLEPFADALRWATQSGDEFTEHAQFIMFLKVLLVNVVDSFPAVWDLIIMVNVDRGEDISWEQLEIIRGDDPDLWRLRAGGNGRCHSLYLKYEALNRELVEDHPWRGWAGRALPELSFACRRPVRSPPRLTIE